MVLSSSNFRRKFSVPIFVISVKRQVLLRDETIFVKKKKTRNSVFCDDLSCSSDNVLQSLYEIS